MLKVYIKNYLLSDLLIFAFIGIFSLIVNELEPTVFSFSGMDVLIGIKQIHTQKLPETNKNVNFEG